MPLQPPASWLRRVQRQARGRVRSRFRGWAPWLGYVYLALALTCMVEESAALGVVGLVLGVPVTWACGLWVVPRSEDAYVLAVSKALQDWRMDVERARRRHAAENREMAATILGSFPASLQPELRQKLGSILEIETESTEPTRELVYASIISSYEQLVMLRATLVQIENADGDRASAFQAAVTTLLDAKQTASREFLDALGREQVGLAEITPPLAFRKFHNAYLQLCSRYSDAVTACYEAIEDERKDSVQQTAQEVCDLWQARQDYSRAMANRLQEYFGGSS
jgi:hypothetical protein